MDSQSDSTSSPPQVGVFRQILIWPLLLKWGERVSGRQVLDECAARLLLKPTQWEEFDVVAQRGSDQAPYEEIIYFHPFVRDFLYGDAPPPKGLDSMRVFQHKGVSSNGDSSVEFKVGGLKGSSYTSKVLTRLSDF